MASWHVPGYVGNKAMGKVSKVVVLGQKGCGKTSILEQAIYGNLEKTCVYPTIEDVYPAHIENDKGIKERIRFYDYAGLEPKTREVPKHYLSFADAIVLVYAINDQDSFKTVEYLKKDIDRNKEKRDLTLLVLANKKDLDSSRVIEQSIALSWANTEKVRVFEVSAFDRKSLMEPLVYLATKLNPPPAKSTFAQLGRKAKGGNSVEL